MSAPGGKERVLHCWADHQELDATTGGWVSFTCMLPDGHAGEHDWTPDSEIEIEFCPKEELLPDSGNMTVR